MPESFKDGTVVQLKSGGPLMTVSSFDDERDQYHCEWFANNQHKSSFFNGLSLKEYKEENW